MKWSRRTRKTDSGSPDRTEGGAHPYVHRVAPSKPYGTEGPSLVPRPRQELNAMYEQALEAEQGGQSALASRLYERVAADYLSAPSLDRLSGAVAFALLQSAALSDRPGSYGFAGQRYVEAAEALEKLAEIADSSGEADAAEAAKERAKIARRQASQAEQMHGSIMGQQNVLARQDESRSANRLDSLISKIGRI